MSSSLAPSPRFSPAANEEFQPLRILFTAFTYPPQRNGVAEAVGTVARGLAERGHEVTIATSHDARRAGFGRDSIRVEQFRLSGSRTDAREEIARYRTFVAAFRGDIIICHCWQAWSTDLVVEQVRSNPARAIFVSHGYAAHFWMPSPRFAWGLGAWLRGLSYVAKSIWILRAFDVIVFLSRRKDFVRFLDHWVVSRAHLLPTAVIPNGAPDEFFEKETLNLRETWGTGDQCVFLCVSTYVDSKNQKLALRAFRRAGSPGVLVFVGQELNGYSRELREMAAKSDRESGNVLVLEDGGGSFVRDCYAACDVFVLPSRRETQPLTILQAMAMGRPFISTNVGCVKELSGGIVVSGEAEMAEAIKSLAEQPSKREALGTAGRVAAESAFRWDSVVSAYEELCMRLAAGNQESVSEHSRTQREREGRIEI